MKVLAISGSLRSGSRNSTVLRAAAFVSKDVEIRPYFSVGDVPHFNQDLDDLDNNIAPAPVLELRRQLRDVDGVMICSPEYAHGVAGAMKNALDWLVGSGEFVEKPTLVMNLSPSSVHAHAAIVETLRTMGAIVVERKMSVPISGRVLTVEELLALPVAREFIEGSVFDIAKAIDEKKNQESNE